MKAIIKTGGKQYQVAEGTTLKIEKLPNVETGKKVVFDQVLLLIDDKDNITVGKPYIAKAKVEATLVNNLKTKKVDVLKYKNKTRYTVRHGHRHHLSQVKIDKIVL
ncbi:50S ribosomal protein L21 [Candidatus Parcubacteria bacterium]|nr:MAG: 50S ribosomal protein L21 [Candidatus Parcubacteria bacterium]